jgi:hypothetical protein
VAEDVNVDDQQSHFPAGEAAFIPAPLLGTGKFLPRNLPYLNCRIDNRGYRISADRGVVRDESLKKMLMSWYYAGYYTGYFEGQRAQQQ